MATDGILSPKGFISKKGHADDLFAKIAKIVFHDTHFWQII